MPSPTLLLSCDSKLAIDFKHKPKISILDLYSNMLNKKEFEISFILNLAQFSAKQATELAEFQFSDSNPCCKFCNQIFARFQFKV